MSGLLVVVERVQINGAGISLEDERFRRRVRDSEEDAISSFDLANSFEGELANALDTRANNDKSTGAGAKRGSSACSMTGLF